MQELGKVPHCEGEHAHQAWQAVVNLEADALSRLWEGHAVPARLQGLPRDLLQWMLRTSATFLARSFSSPPGCFVLVWGGGVVEEGFSADEGVAHFLLPVHSAATSLRPNMLLTAALWLSGEFPTFLAAFFALDVAASALPGWACCTRGGGPHTARILLQFPAATLRRDKKAGRQWKKWRSGTSCTGEE